MIDLSGQRILVVEDSWHLGVALKSLLRSVGAEVVGPVATSADAERLVAEQVPDVAIVDLVCAVVRWPSVSSTN
jgi:DNA-binding response OmpR family regulator